MSAIASGIDWAQVQGAILEWMAQSTGLTVAWAKQPRRTEGAKPFGTLGFLGGPRRVHHDGLTKTSNGDGTITRTLTGQREFTIQAQVYTNDATPTGHAIGILARAQDALELPEFKERLAGAGVAIVSSQPIQDLSAIGGADWESRAAMDVIFRVAMNRIADTKPTIANHRHSLKLRDGNDGQPIVVPKP